MSESRPRVRSGAVKALAALVATVAVLTSACSDSGGESSDRTTTTDNGAATTTVPGGGTTPEERTCDRKVEDPPTVEPAADKPDDLTMTSFDDSRIRLHWYPTDGATKDEPAPTILQGPGWGQAGAEDDPSAGSFLGSTSVHGLRKAGYNVLTWDPRGFGKSTGTVTVDGPDEVRDVQLMLDWLATQPEVQLDGEGDPRTGMVGGSYGGGIQLGTAAADCRVDAIVPSITWHSLTTSLHKNDTYKQGWANFLSSLTKGRDVDPHITESNKEGNATGEISAENVDWFAERGPGDAVATITAPTLLLQGTVDTLFTLDESVVNYEALQDAGTTVAMIWFCGGHGYCEVKAADGDPVADATLAWLDRYVRGNEDTEVPPAFTWIEADGTAHESAQWPLGAGDPLRGEGTGRLTMSATGGAGPDTDPTPGQMLAGIGAGITPTKASNAVNIEVPVDAASTVLGAPKLELTYTAELPANALVPRPPDRLFAQVVGAGGRVVGHQITPFAVEFDGEEHSTTVELETIVAKAEPGSSFTLQLVSATTAYYSAVQVGEVDITAASVELPTVTDLGGGGGERRT